jgi:hypothetical protein
VFAVQRRPRSASVRLFDSVGRELMASYTHWVCRDCLHLGGVPSSFRCQECGWDRPHYEGIIWVGIPVGYLKCDDGEVEGGRTRSLSEPPRPSDYYGGVENPTTG